MSRKSAVRFLSKNGMYWGDLKPKALVARFLKEMDQGLAGKASTLKMIPAYIEVDAGKAVPRKPVTVIDAGGTNFRVAVVEPAAGGVKVLRMDHHPMPGVERELSKAEFFETVAGYVAPFADVSETIGFCFSYPSEIFPDRDGRLIHFVKEVKAKEVEGEKIGAGLHAALAKKGAFAAKRSVILNDTVATLLAGFFAGASKAYGSYIGFILGTGTNTAYVERNAAILKVPGFDPGKSQAINIESGAWGGMPRGRLDLAFDATLQDPGSHPFEKMISGAYLGPLALSVFKAAAKGGLMSEVAATKWGALASLETRDLGVFLSDPAAEGPLTRGIPGEDVDTLWYLADALLDRAALLASVNLAAVVIQSGSGTDPRHPVGIVAEGSTIHKLHSFRSKIDFHLKGLLDAYGRHAELLVVENATLTGSAVAGLLG